MKLIQIRVEDDAHKAFKLQCVQNGTTMQDAILEFIESQIARTSFLSDDTSLLALGSKAKVSVRKTASP